MGTNEKIIERFKSLPTNFSFEEMERLLSIFGYEKSNKGKTSGSISFSFVPIHVFKFLQM